VRFGIRAPGINPNPHRLSVSNFTSTGAQGEFKTGAG